MTELLSVQGSTWKAEYGEISDRPLFRFGYLGSQSWEYVTDIGNLGDLISVLTAVEPLPVDQLTTGTYYQARKLDNLNKTVVVEPYTPAGYPVRYFDLYSVDLADLISILTALQSSIPDDDPTDWDYSNPEIVMAFDRYGNVTNDVAEKYLEQAVVKVAPKVNDPIMTSVLEDTDSDFTTALKATFIRAVRVGWFGAVGDGVTDDTAAFQAAADALSNGGELCLDDGKTYWLSGAVVLHSGTVVNGQGATVRKLAGSSDRCTFVNKSEENATGYGSGGRDITIRDVNFRGDYTIPFENYKDMCLAFHHVEGLLVENCTFSEAMHNSHYIDLLGCTDVVIRGNRFRGCEPISGRNYIEAIQLDSSRRSAASFDGEEVTSYDGLPCRNVLIEGNTFTTLQIGETTYAMPRPIGMHGPGSLTTDDGVPENYRVVGNHFEGYISTITTGDYGWINFPGTRGVVISGNTFKCTGGSTSAIGAVIAGYSITDVVPLSEVQNTPADTEELGSARVVDAWTVSDNTFIGFDDGSTDTDYGLIDVRGSTASQVTIQGNTVRSAAVSPILIDGCRATVTGNNTFSDYGGIRVVGGVAHVTGNSFDVDGASSEPILVDGGGQHILSANYTNGGGNGIRLKNVNNGIVEGNFVNDYDTSGIVVGADADSGTCWDCLVAGNRLRSSNTPSASISLGTKSTRTMRYGNRYRDGGAISDSGSGTLTDATDTN